MFMPNLKIDLLNQINNEKYFLEIELVRLAQEPNMNYKEKITKISEILGKIAIVNAQISGIETYFREPVPVTNQKLDYAPDTEKIYEQGSRIHPGQTHGE